MESELIVVPTGRHVERLAHEGRRAETRRALRARLAKELLGAIAFADRRECRLVLTMALAEDARISSQLGLFGTVSEPNPRRASSRKDDDLLLGAIRARGGSSWARTVAALDTAIGTVRALGGTSEHLERIGHTKGFIGARARTLATAMESLDARLARANRRDERLMGMLLADAIRDASTERVEAALGTRSLRARWILAWDPSDAAWWRALDEKLAPRGGGARVVLPMFDRPLVAGRERDPLDRLADEIARVLDAPTESECIEPVLGYLSDSDAADLPRGAIDARRVSIVTTANAIVQGRAAAARVRDALERGAAADRIVLAVPSFNEHTLAPLRQALDAEGIVAFEAGASSPASAPVILAALSALEAAASMDRLSVARLLRSGWVDASALSDEDARAVSRRLTRLAKQLESNATAAGDDAAARLVRTATAPSSLSRKGIPEGNDADVERDRDVALASRLAAVLERAGRAATRGERIHGARRLFADLGIGARAGRGGLATFATDDPPLGVARAERIAIARDARAWDVLVDVLSFYEVTAHRVGAIDQSVDAAEFRLELIALLDAHASQPSARRAGAVRIEQIADLAGETFDALVVLDANEGLLPRDDVGGALVSEALLLALEKATRRTASSMAGEVRTRDLAGLAVAAAGASSITFLHPTEDGAGSPIGPSSVVLALERAGIAADAPAPERRALPSRDVSLRVAREAAREGFFLSPVRLRTDVVGDIRPTGDAERLLVLETGGADRALAVTSLERYARCAFMGFSHVVLGARDAETREELPDAREEGTLVHEALAAAFVATRELWPRRPRDAVRILAGGQAAADEVLHRWQGHAPLRAIVRLRVADAVRAVLESALADDDWNFILAEQAFGGRGPGAWPALTLSDGALRVSLRGSIDRVDRAHDGRSLRVVDYKRGKSTVQASNASLGETALQVALYASVASRELALPATGAYLPTQARDVGAMSKPSSKAAQRMDELLQRAPGALHNEIERRALGIASSIRSGALAPVPAKESECLHCDVSGGCRKPRFAMAPAEEAEEERQKQGNESA